MMKRCTVLSALCLIAGLGAYAPAQAGWFDSLFGQAPSSAASPAAADGRQRTWRIGDFSGVQLVPREAGAAANQHPVTLAAEALRQQLGLIQNATPNGSQAPLFAPGELAELIGPLVAAFANAGPGDDVLLLSASRREGGIFLPPTAITARLFVQNNSLQIVLHDARADFYDNYRGTQAPPKFSYGSRTQTAAVTIQSPSATSTRADWLALPLGAAVVAAPAPVPALVPAPLQAPLPALVPAPAAAPAPLAAAPPPAAAAVAAPAPRAKPAAAVPDGDEVEQRLLLLKRLRDKNLITEDEYQQKRAAILKLL